MKREVAVRCHLPFSPLMKVSPLVLLIMLALGGLARGADLIASGSWNENITAANLVSGAGSDLAPQFESIPGVTTLTISNAPGSWTLRVRLSGSGGHGDVTVLVKRTSDGTGSGSIADGSAYLALTGSDTTLFSGSEARSNISLQFKLTGLSRSVSPGTYLSSIIFTVSP